MGMYHIVSKIQYHEPLQDPKTLCCQDISLVTTKHLNAEFTITKEL